jgi:hypothetical protein
MFKKIYNSHHFTKLLLSIKGIYKYSRKKGIYKYKYQYQIRPSSATKNVQIKSKRQDAHNRKGKKEKRKRKKTPLGAIRCSHEKPHHHEQPPRQQEVLQRDISKKVTMHKGCRRRPV